MEVTKTSFLYGYYLKISDLYRKNTLVCLVSLLLILSLFFYKALFFAFIFILSDLLKSYVKARFKIRIYLDTLVIGVIILSYAVTPVYGVMMSLFLIINRLPFGTIEKRHLIKTVNLALISLLVSLLNKADFFLVAMFAYVFRYFLEYLVDYLIGSLDFKRFFIRLFHIFTASIFFSFFGDVLITILRS